MHVYIYKSAAAGGKQYEQGAHFTRPLLHLTCSFHLIDLATYLRIHAIECCKQDCERQTLQP